MGGPMGIGEWFACACYLGAYGLLLYVINIIRR